MVDKDSTEVDDEFSRLRHCEEAYGACFFNLTAVIDKYNVTSPFKSLFVFGQVFLGAPEPKILFGIIQRGINAADLFN